MIILDYLAYELSLIILPMWKVLLHASTLGWSGEYLELEKGNDAAASAKPSCCKIREFFQTRRLPQQRAEEEGEYSDELSWAFSRKTSFQTFWATIHQEHRVLEKIWPRRRKSNNDVFHILTFSTTSQGWENNEATYSLRESDPQPRDKNPTQSSFLLPHSIWEQSQRGWLLVRRRHQVQVVVNPRKSRPRREGKDYPPTKDFHPSLSLSDCSW